MFNAFIKQIFEKNIEEKNESAYMHDWCRINWSCDWATRAMGIKGYRGRLLVNYIRLMIFISRNYFDYDFCIFEENWKQTTLKLFSFGGVVIFRRFFLLRRNVLISNGFSLVRMGVQSSEWKEKIILEGEKKDLIDHLDYQLI